MGNRVIRALTVGAITALATLSPTPAQGAFPGQNGKIAFSGYSFGIRAVNPDGTGLTFLTNMGNDLFPAWSADGAKIAFQHGSDIWTMNADGSGQQMIRAGQEPSWSPDGTKIAYASGEAPAGIWIMDADGSNRHPLTQGRDPAWSPDGNRIAFASRQRHTGGDSQRGSELYTIRPDGTGLQRLTTASNVCRDVTISNTWTPDWSPDATKLVYGAQFDWSCEGAVPSYSLRIVNADGAGDHHLGGWSEMDTSPAWSPDGTQIAFTEDNGDHIATISAGGGNTTFVAYGWDPSWQPIPSATPGGYPRPKGAAPIHASLVPAYSPCGTPNREHGPPLSFGSCNPPQPASPNLTLGGNGAGGPPAKSTGYMRIDVTAGALGPPDTADAVLTLKLSNVMNASGLTDYTGELRATSSIRMTDRDGSAPTTLQDFTLGMTVPCTPTADTTLGSACDVQTSFDSVLPGLATEGMRSVEGLGPLRIFDGGPDGDADTEGDNSLFAMQGIFVP